MADQERTISQHIIEFGPFELDVGERTLCRQGRPVHVRERELSILIYLAMREGTFVSRDELISAIWAGSNVTDANVRVQMAGLRRLLNLTGAMDAVTFVHGRGYKFLGRPQRSTRLAEQDQAEPSIVKGSPTRFSPSRTHNLPVRIKPLFGREDQITRLISHLPLHRLVTVVGPGGVGKTTIALAGAEAMVDSYEDGIRLVDLAGLSDPRLVSATVAMALNTSLLTSNPTNDLVKFLRDKQILILLDNCEHLIDEIAELVETILRQTRDVHFLTTSREPLRVDGEWLFRLGPLDTPPCNGGLNALEIESYSSVRLFVERVRLSDNQFELSDANTVAVADLCRRLDGIPLAVELAAAQVGLFGVKGLSDQLADNFSALTHGRRTARQRHQTLRATLDWSYELLSQRERGLLARLAIFRGGFTLSAAQAVTDMATYDIVDGLAELTTKSLLNVDTSGHPALYRMLFLTRDYALAKLRASGEFNQVAKSHAKTYLSLLQDAGSEISRGVSDIWIDDVRSALNWSLSDDGDFEIAMELVLASFGTALRIASLHERGLLLDQASARIEGLGERYPVFEMRMLIEKISVLQFSENKEEEMVAISEKAMALAREIQRDLGDITPLLEALITQVSIYFGEANAPEMKNYIRTIRDLPLSDEQRATTVIVLERMEFQAEYIAGNPTESRSLIEKVLSYPAEVLRARHFTVVDFISPTITGRIFLSRIQWTQGFPEEATRTASHVLALSSSFNAIVQCYVLALSAIPIAIWRGDSTYAHALVAHLKMKATESSLAYWQSWVPYYHAVLDAGSSPLLNFEVPDLVSALAMNAMQVDHLTTFTPYLLTAAEERLEAGYAAWHASEAYRQKGERHLQMGDLASAQELFQRALEIAKTQSALGWELRAAVSLANLWRIEDKRAEASALLSNTVDRFTEGFHDADLVSANRLLKELRAHDAS